MTTVKFDPLHAALYNTDPLTVSLKISRFLARMLASVSMVFSVTDILGQSFPWPISLISQESYSSLLV